MANDQNNQKIPQNPNPLILLLMYPYRLSSVSSPTADWYSEDKILAFYDIFKELFQVDSICSFSSSASSCNNLLSIIRDQVIFTPVCAVEPVFRFQPLYFFLFYLIRHGCLLFLLILCVMSCGFSPACSTLSLPL